MAKYIEQSATGSKGFLTIALNQDTVHSWVVAIGNQQNYFLLQTITAPRSKILQVTVYDPSYTGTAPNDKHTTVYERDSDQASDAVTFSPGIAVKLGGEIKVLTDGPSEPTLIGRVAT